MNRNIKIFLIIVIILVIIIMGILIFLNIQKRTTMYSSRKNSKTAETVQVALNTTDSYSPTVNETSNNENNSSVPNVNFNRTPENVQISIVDDTITENGVTIIITDNNEIPYTYGENFIIEKNDNDVWEELIPNQTPIVQAVAYTVDDKNQLTLNLNWNEYYGVLENGTYRIVKTVVDNNEDIKLYSDEFEIN